MKQMFTRIPHSLKDTSNFNNINSDSTIDDSDGGKILPRNRFVPTIHISICHFRLENKNFTPVKVTSTLTYHFLCLESILFEFFLLGNF